MRKQRFYRLLVSAVNRRDGRIEKVYTTSTTTTIMAVPDSLDFIKNKDGLIPAIAQDKRTGEILMLAYINEEALEKTLKTGKAHYWSRSRQSLWLKGESSGHVQMIDEVLVDCDGDTVVYKVDQIGGAACHKGYRSCFYRVVDKEGTRTIGETVFDPSEVYRKPEVKS